MLQILFIQTFKIHDEFICISYLLSDLVPVIVMAADQNEQSLKCLYDLLVGLSKRSYFDNTWFVQSFEGLESF